VQDGELIRSYNLPVGAHLMVENGEKIKAGKVLKFHVVLLNQRYY
jgi:DNA-directed RNA polymerase subunit beta'